MKWVIPAVMVILVISTGAEAKNQVYGIEGRGVEGEGYKLFISDRIVDTVYRADSGTGSDAPEYCSSAAENTTHNLGGIDTIRSDSRLAIPATTKVSYSAACSSYNAVVDRLRTANGIRKLWLLFGDSATDDFAVETLKSAGTDEKISEEAHLLIELKRLAIVSKYIEFFTKNKEWKLTEYTFLSQAFKARKGTGLSPAYIRFIQALLTGDTETAFHVVTSIDMENLGERFAVPAPANLVTQTK
jgi:hypothetical protein